MARSKDELIRVFKALKQKAKEYGFHINEKKTKYIEIKDNTIREQMQIKTMTEQLKEYIF